MTLDLNTIELILKYGVLPVVVLGTILGAGFYYDSLTASRQIDDRNRRVQLQGAKDTYQQVMDDAERLLACMRYHAWNVAWRKSRPEGIFSEDLIEDDEGKWRKYDEALFRWRQRRIQYQASVEQYFGGPSGSRRRTSSTSSAVRNFRLLDANLDKLAFELWFIYHGNPNNPNIFLQYYVPPVDVNDVTTAASTANPPPSPYQSVFNAIMTASEKHITEEQETNVHRATSIAFDEMQERLERLCSEMNDCIRNENVGTLRLYHNNGRGLRQASPSRRRSRR
jgi:hypothetical protein